MCSAQIYCQNKLRNKTFFVQSQQSLVSIINATKNILILETKTRQESPYEVYTLQTKHLLCNDNEKDIIYN